MSQNPLHVLIVDDDKVDVMSAQRALKKINITDTVYVAENGVVALAMLQGEGQPQIPRPDFILLDLNMPKMGGLELLQHLRRNPILADLLVLVMTGSDDEGKRLQAQEANVSGYITKPITLSKLAKEITSFGHY